MIVFYYILCLLEILTKAWTDHCAFDGGLFHLADIIHYTALIGLFYYIYLIYPIKKEWAYLFLIYIFLRFAWFDYWLNLFRGNDMDYGLFLYDTFGRFTGFVKTVAMMLALVTGFIFYKNRNYEYYHE